MEAAATRLENARARTLALKAEEDAKAQAVASPVSPKSSHYRDASSRSGSGAAEVDLESLRRDMRHAKEGKGRIADGWLSVQAPNSVVSLATLHH